MVDKWVGFRKGLCRVTHKSRVFTSKGALWADGCLQFPSSQKDDKTQEMEARFLAKFCNRTVLYPKMSPPDGVWIEASYFFGLTGDRQKPAGLSWMWWLLPARLPLGSPGKQVSMSSTA